MFGDGWTRYACTVLLWNADSDHMNECPGTVGRFIVIAHASPTCGWSVCHEPEYKPVLVVVYYWIGIRIGVGVDTELVSTQHVCGIGLYALNLS
jgi:hypothetical protein